jgi:hypothetical protein
MATIPGCRMGCAHGAPHTRGAMKAIASVSTSEKAVGLNTETLWQPWSKEVASGSYLGMAQKESVPCSTGRHARREVLTISAGVRKTPPPSGSEVVSAIAALAPSLTPFRRHIDKLAPSGWIQRRKSPAYTRRTITRRPTRHRPLPSSARPLRRARTSITRSPSAVGRIASQGSTATCVAGFARDDTWARGARGRAWHRHHRARRARRACPRRRASG